MKQRTTYGTRLHRDPFYQSSAWDRTKEMHKQGYTLMADGIKLSNIFCVQCYHCDKSLTPMHTVDHIIAIEDGGSRTDQTNLQSMCLSCHNSKSAREGNKRRRK